MVGVPKNKQQLHKIVYCKTHHLIIKLRAIYISMNVDRRFFSCINSTPKG